MKQEMNLCQNGMTQMLPLELINCTKQNIFNCKVCETEITYVKILNLENAIHLACSPSKSTVRKNVIMTQTQQWLSKTDMTFV